METPPRSPPTLWSPADASQRPSPLLPDEVHVGQFPQSQVEKGGPVYDGVNGENPGQP